VIDEADAATRAEPSSLSAATASTAIQRSATSHQKRWSWLPPDHPRPGSAQTREVQIAYLLLRSVLAGQTVLLSLLEPPHQPDNEPGLAGTGEARMPGMHYAGQPWARRPTMTANPRL
jgi:hypothetical protein